MPGRHLSVDWESILKYKAFAVVKTGYLIPAVYIYSFPALNLSRDLSEIQH